MRKPGVVIAAVAVLAVLPLAGCGAAKDAGNAGVRTLSAKLGAAEFKDKGHPIDGELTCRTKTSSDTYTVTCTGKDTGGKPVSMAVNSVNKKDDSDTRVRGTIVGKVDGKDLFRDSCLGDHC